LVDMQYIRHGKALWLGVTLIKGGNTQRDPITSVVFQHVLMGPCTLLARSISASSAHGFGFSFFLRALADTDYISCVSKPLRKNYGVGLDFGLPPCGIVCCKNSVTVKKCRRETGPCRSASLFDLCRQMFRRHLEADMCLLLLPC
jgi:hypothetical protein